MPQGKILGVRGLLESRDASDLGVNGLARHRHRRVARQDTEKGVDSVES